jgi:hypothetical protein
MFSSDRQFTTPLTWCSIPRACSTIARSASPSQCAAFSIASGGTPVISAARASVHSFTEIRHRLEAGGVGLDEGVTGTRGGRAG